MKRAQAQRYKYSPRRASVWAAQTLTPACRAARRPTCTEISAEKSRTGVDVVLLPFRRPLVRLEGRQWSATANWPTACRYSAIARPTGAAGTGSKILRNVLSHNQCYTYGMTIATGRRPCSTLGDQQLLDQTRRLAANQRSLEVHILDHLDEIDRRNLALRRGFSSLFDYAVRELRFSDAAAQRRIQTMRLCRRHGWVRAMLHSGDLSLTAAAQMETALGTAERQSRRASPTVGLEQCHDVPRLPAWPSVTCDRDAEESGAGAGVAGAVAMTASAAHDLVAAGREARSSGDAGGHEHGHTGSDRGRPSSDQPAAVAARPAAAGAQPAGRLESSAATTGAAPPSMPERAKCRGNTSAPERGVESLRGGESREAGSKHVPDWPDSNAATLHAPRQAAPGRAPRTGLAGKLAGMVAADTPVLPVASHAAARHAAAGVPMRCRHGWRRMEPPRPLRRPPALPVPPRPSRIRARLRVVCPRRVTRRPYRCRSPQRSRRPPLRSHRSRPRAIR